MDFPIFDADNHYYEAEDCFLRHADTKVKKHVRWLADGRRRYLAFGNSIPADVPNATFDPVSPPGLMHLRLKQLEAGAHTPLVGQQDMTSGEVARAQGIAGTGRDLVAISPEYRDRTLRLAKMDEQGVEKAFLFPTLGQSVETMVTEDPDMMYRVFRAFNDWLADDWGYAFDGRIYAPPVVPMMEINGAVAEFDRVIAMGAKAVCLRAGPVYGRSPADPYFDPFWARINEAGTLVGFHALAGPTPYHDGFKAMWTRPTDDREHMKTVELSVFPFERPAMDSLTAMTLGNTFGRFPNLKVAVVEMGGSWMEYLMHTLDHAGGIFERRVNAFGQDLKERPSDVLKRHVWVSPFPEEDVVRLTQVLGVDHVLMGSDWPHPEGTVTPGDYVQCLEGLDDASIRKVMRDNALEPGELMYDLVIRNGTVVDGSGSAPVQADVGVTAGRITTVGRITETGTREIDAEGHVVTPGFIDPHTHLDAQMFWDHVGANSCWHGVTTAVMGNCGFTIAPGSADQRALLVRNLERAEDMSAAALDAGIDWSWRTYPEYLDAIEKLPMGINYAAQVGHSAVRCHVMGERAFTDLASDNEIRAMERHVAEAIAAGAWGFTTSRTKNHLTPAGDPVASRIGSEDELSTLLRASAQAGGRMYQYVEDSPTDRPIEDHQEELFRLSAETGLTFVIPASGNPLKTLPFLDRAAAAGASFVGVTHPRGISNWSSFRTRLPFDAVPEWAAIRSLPLDQQRAILSDPVRRETLVKAALGHSYAMSTGAEARPPDYDRMRVLTGPVPPWPTVNEAAAARGVDPVTLIIELSLAADFEQFFIQPLGGMDAENTPQLLAHESVVMGFSDSGAHVSQMADASITTHMLAYWVRARQAISIERAVRLMTSAITEKWGMADRGLVREGYIADLNVIDLARVMPSMPVMKHDLPTGAKRIEQRAVGYKATIVAGTPLIEDGEHTGAHPGALLRRR